MRRLVALLTIGALTAVAGSAAGVPGTLAASVADSVRPIPQQVGAGPVPHYVGHPAIGKPVLAPAVPQNPFLSPNPFNNAQDDTYMSDTYFTPGVLGRHPVVSSAALNTRTYPVAVGVRPTTPVLA
jgi:hypothetical protein